jgi:Fe-S oxidoreductase
MALPIIDSLESLADTLGIRRSQLPIPVESAIAWTRGLNLPRGGETVLYTGLTYQLVPYLEALAAETRRREGTAVSFPERIRRLEHHVHLAGVLARPSAEERAPYDEILRNIARLLLAAGVTFGSLYEEDLYTGAFAEGGLSEEELRTDAERVAEVLRRHGVRRVITVDPHTTHLLASVYPSILPDFQVEVRTYLEVLAERRPELGRPLAFRVALHDACLYARRAGGQEVPRVLLTEAGVDVAEPEFHGQETWCCGGATESLFPDLAEENARARVAQLAEAAPNAVTMCPLCLFNLRKGARGTVKIDDISHYLFAAYGPAE